MHELSIIYSVVDTVTGALAGQGGGQVVAVRLRVGVLAGVERDSLLFGYDLATQGTSLAGSRLEIEEVPVAIFCSSCDAVHTLEGIQSFRCPQCGKPSGDLRRGRELEITSIEIETEDAGSRALPRATSPNVN